MSARPVGHVFLTALIVLFMGHDRHICTQLGVGIADSVKDVQLFLTLDWEIKNMLPLSSTSFYVAEKRPISLD